MKRIAMALVIVALLSGSALPAWANARGETVWTPYMNSPVNFLAIQQDKGTAALDVIAKIYPTVSQEKWPEASNNAEHAAIAR